MFYFNKKQRILQFHMYFSNYFSCNYFLSRQHRSTSKISQQNIYRPRQTWKITQLHVHQWVQGLNIVKRTKKTITIQKTKKTAPAIGAGPQLCKAESNKRKQQAPN
jgi:hypothetical protein